MVLEICLFSESCGIGQVLLWGLNLFRSPVPVRANPGKKSKVLCARGPLLIPRQKSDVNMFPLKFKTQKDATNKT